MLLVCLIFVDDLEVDGLAGHEGECVVKADLVVTQLLHIQNTGVFKAELRKPRKMFKK